MPKPLSPRRPAASLLRMALCGIGLLALVGCRQEPVRHYQADRVPQRERPRLVAVLVPRGAQTWFFKLQGPEFAVERHFAEFTDFLGTVRFTDADPPVVWTAPGGWTEERGGEAMRYATLHLGSPDQPLEATVTMLGRGAADLGSNVNRWRDQLGLGPLAETELPNVTRSITIDGVKSELVDFVGPGSAPSSADHGPPPAAEAGPPIHFDTPPGWHETADPVALSAFEVADGGQTATATVTRFGGAGGGLLLNVNRWRGQVGLKPVNEDDVKNLPVLSVGGTESRYVDLSGAPGGQGMLGVITPRGDVTWFFKLSGPAELVGKQKSAFESFVKSVRFEEGKGAPHE